MAEPMNDAVMASGALFAALGILGVLFIALMGYTMKFALSVSGAGKFGFWYSFLIAVASTLAMSITSTLIVVAVGPSSAVFAWLFGFVACLGVIALMSGTGVFHALGIYLLNGFFSFIGVFALVIAAVAAVAGLGACGVKPPAVLQDFERLRQASLGSSGEGADWNAHDLDAQMAEFEALADKWNIQTDESDSSTPTWDAMDVTNTSIPAGTPADDSVSGNSLWDDSVSAGEATGETPWWERQADGTAGITGNANHDAKSRSTRTATPKPRPAPAAGDADNGNPTFRGIQRNPFVQ